MPPDEKALIEAFRAGDEFAFVTLYNRHKGAVYAFAAKMLVDRAAAEDVLQETFVRVYENRERLDRPGSFKAWLFTIARNQCLNHLRKHRREVAFEVEPVAAETPLSRLAKSEQVALVNGVLEGLKPEYREVLVLREYQGLSYDEIAAVTRNTVSSVKSRLFKARRKLGAHLRPLLDPEGAPSERALSEGASDAAPASAPRATPR